MSEETLAGEFDDDTYGEVGEANTAPLPVHFNRGDGVNLCGESNVNQTKNDSEVTCLNCLSTLDRLLELIDYVDLSPTRSELKVRLDSLDKGSWPRCHTVI